MEFGFNRPTNAQCRKPFTSDAALAEDAGVVVDDENEFDDHVKRDERRHDDHTPVGQTELPDTEEHGRRYSNQAGRCFSHVTVPRSLFKLAATLRGSRPRVQSATPKTPKNTSF